MENELYGFTLTKLKGSKYKVKGNNCPDDMFITIKKQRNGYRAECNYSLKTKTAANAYQAMHLRPTLEETLEHLLISLQPNKDTTWEKVR
jgi:hypothetical protein